MPEETGMEGEDRGPPSTQGGHSLRLLLLTPAAPHPVSLLAAETATLTGPEWLISSN